ncbi:10497_t:CDS:2, partial [Dentiscutata heterogama]
MLAADQLPLGINASESPIQDDTGKATFLTTQLIFATAIGVTSFLLFCLLRTRWSTMFAPRSRLRLEGLAPQSLPDSFFWWIVTLFKIPESEVLDLVGLDAAVLLSFFVMSYRLFAVCSFFGLVVLSPIKLTGYMPGNYSKNPQDDNPIGIPENDQLESYGILLSYAIFTWVFSFATFYFTYENYREFSIMRHRYYCKWKNTISARTVMVTVLPKNLQEEPALAKFYDSLGLGTVESVVVYKNVRKLRHALEKRTYYLRELERSYREYLGNPCDYPDYDPIEALNEFELNKKITVLPNIHRKRPTIRTGCLYLFGKKVDKIDYYTDLFKSYDELVEQGRHGKYKPTSVGFVTFENITSAQLAAQVLIYDEPFQCHTTMAPEPWDVYWHNVIIRKREKLIRTVIVNLVIILMVSSWGLATLRIASLLRLSTLDKVFPWLANLAKRNKFLKWFIQSTLPPIALTALNNILPPKLMSYLSSIQGFYTRSTIELSTFAKYFFFLILTLFEIPFARALLEDIFENPKDIADQLAKTLPGSAPLFINLVVLQGIGLFPVHLLQMGEITFTLFMRIFVAKTPREYAEASAPPFLDY